MLMYLAILLMPACVRVTFCHPDGRVTEKPYLAITTVGPVDDDAEEISGVAQSTTTELVSASIQLRQ